MGVQSAKAERKLRKKVATGREAREYEGKVGRPAGTVVARKPKKKQERGCPFFVWGGGGGGGGGGGDREAEGAERVKSRERGQRPAQEQLTSSHQGRVKAFP